MRKYIAVSILFFIFGIITALINVFLLGLIFHVQNYSFIHGILYGVLAILPIIGFLVLLLKVIQYLKKNMEGFRRYHSLIIVVIALFFTVLPYFLF